MRKRKKLGKATLADMIRHVRRFLRARGAVWQKRDVFDMALCAQKLVGSRCEYCKRTVERVALDHQLPESRGGKTHFFNIKPMHELCNRAKGALSECEWESLVSGLRPFQISVLKYVISRLAMGWRVGFRDERRAR